jgi:hypothetical protein
MALPKATVQLQAPAQALGTAFSSASQMATTQEDDDEEEDEGGGGLMNILSGVGLAAALVVLAFQLMTANVWISAEGSQAKGDWMQLMK